ncbi:MAG TPA: alpha-ketoglutarate-dependent dioxygenase AlkB [Tepidisphaeraceae bacterium]|jgi:alkylated DNA repair dioxygenase AlkB|nr:alpha-ketoglutarate-dependent dioxygenase AlkB [Tepidisphaeraceae bacterium]
MIQQPDLFPQILQDKPTVPNIEGMTYVSDFLSQTEQETVLEEIDRQPWRDDLKRRVQHYGYRYDYKARRVDPSMFLGRLPSFVMPMANKLVERSLFSQRPDQLIVNEYLPGQGITAHIDCEPCFAGAIAMVSLGWAYEMEFIHSQTRDVRAILLAAGSALVITGPARYDWQHQIRARRNDRGVPRQRRVSLTFRNVLLCDVG